MPEKSTYKTRFTGTIDENFRDCAIVSNDGRVVFDKTRNPSLLQETYAATRLHLAYYFAAKASNRTGSTEIVLEGIVKDDPMGDEIPKVIPFIVTLVWAHKKGVDPFNIIATQDRILEFLDAHEPSAYYLQKYGSEIPRA